MGERGLREAAQKLCDTYKLDGIAPADELWWALRAALAAHEGPEEYLRRKWEGEFVEAIETGKASLRGKPIGYLAATHEEGRGARFETSDLNSIIGWYLSGNVTLSQLCNALNARLDDKDALASPPADVSHDMPPGMRCPKCGTDVFAHGESCPEPKQDDTLAEPMPPVAQECCLAKRPQGDNYGCCQLHKGHEGHHTNMGGEWWVD